MPRDTALTQGYLPNWNELDANYESWIVPAGVPSALADIGGRVEANY